LHDPHRRQRTQGSANRGPADAELRDEVTLGWKAVAGTQMAAPDQVADMRDDLIGAGTCRPCCHVRQIILPGGLDKPPSNGHSFWWSNRGEAGIRSARRSEVKDVHSRRDFAKATLSLVALPLLTASRLFAIELTVRGVKLGITTASLNPLPQVPGKDPLDVLIQQLVKLGVGNVELSGGFFGPPVRGAAVGGQVPKAPNPEYEKSREELRQWRLSAASLDRFREVRKKFDDAKINLYSMSNTMADDVTDAELDAMFRQMQALRVNVFQTNQTRVSMGPRLVPFVEKYKIRPSFHTHAEVDDPNEIASVESLQKLLSLSKEFRVCLDIGHFVAGNNDPVAYLREHHDRITHIHVKDRKRNKGPNVEWGTGDTPIKECLTMIRDNKWPIYAFIEREFMGTRGPVEETRRDLDYMKQALMA
jgi:sugar phosphate isomerase/epimerase